MVKHTQRSANNPHVCTWTVAIGRAGSQPPPPESCMGRGIGPEAAALQGQQQPATPRSRSATARAPALPRSPSSAGGLRHEAWSMPPQPRHPRQPAHAPLRLRAQGPGHE